MLIGRYGFDTGERLASTTRAIRSELATGPFVYRYTGVDQEEGAFLACSFWLVLALIDTGDLEAARTLMDELVGLTTDLGLMAEQIDPETHAMLGNFPQGLSHLGLVTAACAYYRATAGGSDP
jgi:GH15 family glucan-1,4-alpha-glucosidase